METSIISLFIGGVGAIATVGTLFFAWKNDQFLRFLPKDKDVVEILKSNVNSEKFIPKLRCILKRNVTSKKKLKSALSIAKEMHFAKPMDEALIEIHKRSLELGDIKFAYKVATNAYFAVSLDEMLMNIVEFSLERNDVRFANKAANRMHFAVSLDKAKIKIIADCGVKT